MLCLPWKMLNISRMLCLPWKMLNISRMLCLPWKMLNISRMLCLSWKMLNILLSDCKVIKIKLYSKDIIVEAKNDALFLQIHLCPGLVELLYFVYSRNQIADFSFFIKGSFVHIITYSTNPGHGSKRKVKNIKELFRFSFEFSL